MHLFTRISTQNSLSSMPLYQLKTGYKFFKFIKNGNVSQLKADAGDLNIFKQMINSIFDKNT